MGAVTTRRIHGAGTDEACWRTADWLEAAAVIELAELLPPGARLVVVSPHPDDEILGCGGLIHDAASAGHAVCVIALTDGEQAYPNDRAWPPHRLAPVRRAELDAALRCLGGTAVEAVHLGLGDGRLAQRQAAIVEALAPLCNPGDVLLATWARDGHRDHEAASRAARSVASGAGLPLFEYPIWGWHWADARRSPFGDGLRRYRLEAPTQACKARALACFASQTGAVVPAPAQPILPPHVLARFHRPFEIFLRT